MKNNTMKRVLAGTLAVLTVAAYVPANVGDFVTGSTNGIVAEAATTSLVTWGGVNDYITSISDGTTSIEGDNIISYDSRRFEEGKVLTIVSSIPLSLSKTSVTTMSKVVDTTIDLAAKNGDEYTNEDKYFETESNGVYTYKVLNNKSLAVTGISCTATVKYTYGPEEKLVLGDGNSVTLASVDNPTCVPAMTPSNGKVTAFKKGIVKITAPKAFEAYVKQNEIDNIPKFVATYDATVSAFVAEVQLPDADATIYLNKVTPNYTYTNTGTALKATAENAPEVTAASITATYEAKVKKNQDEVSDSSQLYKYDTKTDMATGATVPNESRVVLTFTNDTTGEITSANSGGASQFYTLKITKDGQELADNATPFFNVDDAYGTASDISTTYGSVKLASSKYVPGASANTSGTSKLAFSKAGVYKVEYTVYTTSKNASGQTVTSPQKMTYDFTIAPKDLLNESNVRLGVSVPNDTSGENAKKYLVGSTKSEDGNKELVNKVGIENGVVKIEVTDEWMATKPTITVTPTLFADADDAADFTKNYNATFTFAAGSTDTNHANDGTPMAVTGTDKNNVLNVENEMTVIYNNPDYGANAQAVKVKWMLVEQKKSVNIIGNDTDKWKDRNDSSKAFFNTTIDNIDTFKEDLLATVTVTNGDASKLEFEYAEGFGSNVSSDELDEHFSGLPTKPGKYSVFFLYEGEAVEAANVEVNEHALYATLTDEQSSYTYGTKALATEDIKFVDATGKVVEDAGVKNASITYKKALKLNAAQCKKITGEGKITLAKDTDVDGVTLSDAVTDANVYTIGSDKYIENPNTETGSHFVTDANKYLNAGVYIATIAPDTTSTLQTTIAKSGYSLMPGQFTVSVAKKPLTADMITINPQTYTGGTVFPTLDDLKIYDKDIEDKAVATVTKTNFAFSGGDTTGSAVGTYTVGVQAPSNSNYTGKAMAEWNVVSKVKNAKMTGLELDETKTTIFDNGRIHFEVKRPANSQFAKGVAKFGVIYDKTGTLAAPTKNAGTGSEKYPAGKYPKSGNGATGNTTGGLTYTNVTNGFAAKTEFENAATNLQLGNGFGEGLSPDSANNTIYGANVSVVDVETGCWFRPYVIDGAGDIYLGEVYYVNLVQEATEKLQLKMATIAMDYTGVVTKEDAKKDQSSTVLANKTWRNGVHSGYNEKNAKYYVYGSYTLEGNDLVKESAVQGFGVVVDKKGAFTPAGTLVGDETVSVEDGLKLGKGFIEGKAGSNKMDADEYGANISPLNTVTGTWVRAYVDLGRDLVVYTTPIYIPSVSEIYNGSSPEKVKITAAGSGAITDAYATADNQAIYVEETGKQRVNVNSGRISNATLKQSGVIVDKSGSFLTKNTSGAYIIDYTTATAEATAKFATAKQKMILDNGYLQGRKAVDANGKYTVVFTQDKYRPTTGAAEANIPAVIRPFSVYEIYGNDIVIYGDPIVTTVNEKVMA